MIESTAGLLYMKVGTHAKESLSDIIDRKRREIEAAGFAMWGYGGNTCHPSTKVQPFATAHAAASEPIILCMEEIESRHFAEPVRAEEFSPDGLVWSQIPPEINVLGSRYALMIDSIEEVDEELNLGETLVAVGDSKGKPGSEYVKGRVDKACLNPSPHASEKERKVKISLKANIIEPWAVFLKN